MTHNPIADKQDAENGGLERSGEIAKSEATKSVPSMQSKPWLLPICFFIGHDIVPAEDKPGWFQINCGRCGLDTHRQFFRRTRNLPWTIAKDLVWFANRIEKTRSYPGAYFPVYRHIEQQIPGIGGKHSCAAYSYEHIQSLLKQYEQDGLPEPLLSTLISEEGWIDLEEHPEMADEVVNQLNKDLTLEATRREQEELNRDR